MSRKPTKKQTGKASEIYPRTNLWFSKEGGKTYMNLWIKIPAKDSHDKPEEKK